MKEKLLNAITVDLIDKLDFVPLVIDHDTFIRSDKIRLLEKRDIAEYNFIELIDLDYLNDIDIERHYIKESNWIDNIKIVDFIEKPSLIQIFFMQNHITSKVDAIRKFQNYAIDRSINTAFIIVDIENDDLIIDWGLMDSHREIELVIEYWLDNNPSEFEILPDLEDILNRQEPEPTLEEVSKTSPSTYVLIGVNIALWLLGEIFRILYHENLINFWGIKDNSLISAGQYWRLLTPMFLHIDLMHLATNCLSLLIFGSTVERVFGTRKFLLIYLAGGLSGNLMSFLFSLHNSLGASGAISGVGGAVIYLWLKNRYFFSLKRKKYLVLVFLVILNIFYGFIRTGIDNYAHVGGFIGGYLMSTLVNLKKKDLK